MTEADALGPTPGRWPSQEPSAQIHMRASCASYTPAAKPCEGCPHLHSFCCKLIWLRKDARETRHPTRHPHRA